MEELKDKLQRVLDKAHRGHRYVSDSIQYNKPEYWTVSLNGDCEDFALWIREELKKEGIYADLVLCLDENGGYHLVCSYEGYILDNRYSFVMTQQDLSNYTWISVGDSSGNWYKIT